MPVNVWLARGSPRAKAPIAAVDRGFNKSVVLPSLAKLTVVFVSPPTVPVNVWLARDALADKAFVIVVA